MNPVWLIAPCLHHPEQGGIQRCGYSAWQHLQATRPGSQLLTYGPDCAQCHRSKARAALAAAAYAGWRHPVLVWHHYLLKLAGFTWNAARKTAVMLHGIEAWETARPGAFARVNLVCTVSDCTWQRFGQANPALAQLAHQTVPLGFAGEALAAPPPDATPAAVIVARLNRREDYKGHRELIGCWPRVRRQIPDAQLWIIGDGDLRAELQELAQNDPAIRFLGRLPEDEKLSYIQRARCLAMPSRGEGFGLVYLEAMRAGRPCLTGTQDAGHEVIQPPEAGLAVDPAQPEECAAALVRLLSAGPEWDRWSAQARRRYMENYTEAAYHGRLAAALARLENL